MTSRMMVGCWIALLCSSIMPASADPYDIMVGCWKGKGDFYSSDGVYQGSVCSSGVTYWKTRPTLMHFREDQQLCSGDLKDDGLKAVIAAMSTLEYDLQVNKKSLSGGCKQCGTPSADVHVTGTEIHTDFYHFLLNFQNSRKDGSWYNNHYFTGRNTRHVFGSFEQAGHPGEVQFIGVQTLTRLSNNPNTCMSKPSP
jgi:hypothetical protein